MFNHKGTVNDDYPNPAELTGRIHNHRWWPEFQKACPGWEVFFCYMRKDEIIDWGRKIIWMRVRLPHPFCRWTHAASHVIDHPEGMSVITVADEQSADLAAECWRALHAPVQEPDLSDVA